MTFRSRRSIVPNLVSPGQFALVGSVVRSGLSNSGAYPHGLSVGPMAGETDKDPLGSASPYLAKILATHWIRTLLINAYAFILLLWVVKCLARQ